MQSPHIFGAHTSIQGGVINSLLLAKKLGFEALQIFTKNNNRWEAPRPDSETIDKFRKLYEEFNFKFIISHNSYLINLCSADESIREKSFIAFIDEIVRCEELGIKYLNFHPGNHSGQGRKKGIELITYALNKTFEKTYDSGVTGVLETTAGQGTSIGHLFEELAEIIDLTEDKERIKICIDTAHIFAAGYDIVSNYENVISQFDKIIGLDKLVCFHINDSKKECGSKVDRHEHIGKGFIGLKGFENLLNDKRLSAIPFILETPKGKEQLEDIENINILKSLIKI